MYVYIYVYVRYLNKLIVISGSTKSRQNSVLKNRTRLIPFIIAFLRYFYLLETSDLLYTTRIRVYTL